VIHFLAKITYKNKKNQDYILQKKGHELIKGVLISAQDMTLFCGSSAVLCNCCFSTDSRLLLWVGGVLAFMKKRIINCCNNLKKSVITDKRNLHVV
jgi:hypothetical protein